MTDITTINQNIIFYFQQYTDHYWFLVPLGVVGLWRWSVWAVKEIIGSNYKPKHESYEANVSVVTPVYNEDPLIFKLALISWKKNNPQEIIAVIDYTDKICIRIFKEFAKDFAGAVLVITKVPGKRPALATGIKKASSELVALVDSDTIWADDVIKNGLPPFNDREVAGVATYQSVIKPKTFAQKIFDLQLDLRYMHEYPFLAAAGNALVCLSGRTAFYRRSILLPMLHDLIHETFLGKPVISGDDKRLTYLVLAAGWKVAYQSNSHVFTPGMKDLKSYLKQRLRWSRNSLRADLKAILSGWPLRHPALLFFQIDKLLQSFVVILSPIFFIIAVLYQEWLAAIVIFLWWFLSRTIKMYSHLLQKPRNVTLIPGFVLYSFMTGVMKIYALYTLNTQGWITRWDKSRMAKLQFLSAIPAYAGTAFTVMILFYGVYLYKQYTYFIPHQKKDKIISAALHQGNSSTLALNSSVLGVSSATVKDYSVRRYKTKSNTTLTTLSEKFQVDKKQLLYANAAKLPYSEDVPVGTVMSIPGKDIVLDPAHKFETIESDNNPYSIVYIENDNTVVVSGRGRQVRLKDIKNQIGSKYIYEVEPKVWVTKVSIYINRGVTLLLDNTEVEWLKLESNKDDFVILRSYSGDILVSKVKITSWDSNLGDYDKNLDNGRSFILAKNQSRMDFFESELAYLGYPTNDQLALSPYGVSWRITNDELKRALVTGEIVNSKFHNNYFGAYTFGATGMVWRGNEFYDNIRYGLDPHDDSNGFIVENNYAHNNGTHGIIFSKRCMYNIIRNNVSTNNGLHGIMLHEKSNNNIIENNVLTGNLSGVALWRSSNNIVRNNVIEKNKHGVRANVSANGNLIENNKIKGSERYGLFLYEDANKNIIRGNLFEKNVVAVYIKSNKNEVTSNTMTNNDVGVYFFETASGNIASANTITQSGVYGVYTKISNNLSNVLGVNTLYRNRKDIEGQEL